MLTLEQKTAGRTRRVTVTRADDGWLFKEEDNTQLVREITYTDWHRVERAIRAFEAPSPDDLPAFLPHHVPVKCPLPPTGSVG